MTAIGADASTGTRSVQLHEGQQTEHLGFIRHEDRKHGSQPDRLGGEIDADSLDGSGAFDHIAFRANDPAELLERLKARGLDYRERQVPSMDLFQIFVEDPNGITVELNYFGADRNG